MPNLDLARGLRAKYGLDAANNTFLKPVQDSFQLSKSFDFRSLSVSPKVLSAFEDRKECYTVAIYVDITKFSQTTKSLSNKKIIELLEQYYAVAIPIIYKNGGEIQNIIGDGIIAVFGEPFITCDRTGFLRHAEKACMAIIKHFKDTIIEVKCALHSGTVFYLTSGCEPYYNDNTMIGKMVTELFRLESESKNNAITFYTDTDYESLNEFDILERELQQTSRPASWDLGAPVEVSLRGVEYKNVRSLVCIR